MEYHPPLENAIMEYHWPSSRPDERAVGASSSLKRPRSPEDPETAASQASDHRTAYSDSQACTRESVIQQIEAIFTALAISSPTAPLQLSLTPRRRSSSSFDPSTSTIRRPLSTTAAATVVSFPKDAWRFTCILKILDLLHESLVSGRRATTKRDLFYKHPTLFRTQRVVDGLLDDLAATFSVPRDALGVVASAKGMLYGDVVIGGRHFLTDGGGALVPGELDDVVLGSDVAWVLVVEKEAAFRSLACGGGREGVVVTGKGYPDVATREAVRLLAGARTRRGPPLRVFVLVDMDPHGVQIAATYRFGSVAMAWENHRLAVQGVEWVGVKSADLEQAVARARDGPVEGVARLTLRDRRKAEGMLAKSWMDAVPEWRSELQMMLFLGVKAEIEIVSGVGVKEWVEEKIAARMDG